MEKIRYIVSLLFFLPVFSTMFAEEPERWDGFTSVSLDCLYPNEKDPGTAANPYLVKSGGDLNYISKKSEYWNKCFLQINDINLDGKPLSSMIGYAISGQVNNNTAFKGTYDGNGKEIRNLKVDWSVIDNDAHLISFGLFGYINGGTVKNINFISPRIVRERDIVNNNGFDIKIGIVTGSVGSRYTVISNISITDGLITDSGKDPGARSLFIGGIAGDMTGDFETYHNVTKNYGTLTINNISVECNIDLDKCVRIIPKGDQNTQFNVGGMIGRARRVRYDMLPTNTFFKGDIKAPAASISPTVGMARANSDHTKKYYLKRAYAGEVLNSDNMSDTASDSYYVLSGDKIVDKDGNQQFPDANPDNGHYYSDYKIWDYKTDVNDFVRIDGTTPANTGLFGTRTLDDTSYSKTETFNPTNPDDWRCVQGVNHGYYAQLYDFSGNQNVLDMLNEGAGDLKWHYSQKLGSFVLATGSRITLQRKTNLKFEANIDFLFLSEAKQYRWEVKEKGSDSFIIKGYTDTPVFSFGENVNPDDYSEIKVTVCNKDAGNTVYYENELPVQDTILIHPLSYWANIDIARKIDDGGQMRYIASVTNEDDSILMGGETGIALNGYAWKWEVSSDPSQKNSWKPISGADGSIHIPANPDRYYRATMYLTEDNSEILSAVRGPKRLIFLYDKDMSDIGRDLKVTPFTGKYSADDYYPDGNDHNDGYDPYHAVKTMKRAYQLAEEGKTYEDNTIVVMGYYCDPMFWHKDKTEDYNKNVTITGSASGLISGGAFNLSNFGHDDYVRTLGGHTRLKQVTLAGYNTMPVRNIDNTIVTPTNGNVFFYCNLYDFYVDEDVKITKYRNLGAGQGQIKDKTAPHITIVGGYHDRNITDDIVFPEGNAEEGVVTITLKSGCWGRIIGGSRNSKINGRSHNVYGSPEHPHRVNINVSISHPLGKGTKEYCDDNVNYSHDIALLTGGQTDGTIYGDCMMTVSDGTIGRFLSGNISYGRKVSDGYPTDSFFGSCELTLLGGEIEELFGGSLGRLTADTGVTDKCDSYFYGRSIINIKSGTIKSNIYGGGAGGVMGIGKCDHDEHHGHHTSDTHIPYYDKVTNELKYGDFYAARNGIIPKMPLREDGNVLDLEESYCQVNIYSGTIEGNIYGGGYGYSNQITDYTKALSQAGDIFGNVTVTLGSPESGSSYEIPRIKGNVYGGGAGSTLFYDTMVADLISKGKSEETAKEKGANEFGYLARIFGNSTVYLYEGIVDGNVYGGSMGIGKFNDMATIFGNATVILDGATVNGNIFGGCAFANIKKGDINPETKGNAFVEILSGTVGNNIFGGSEGSDDYTSLIEGNTDIKIKGGSFTQDPAPYVYIDPDTKTESTVTRTFNIYGGCYHNGTINGSSSVNIEKSLLEYPQSIAKAVGSDTQQYNFEDAIDDMSYRHFCVYGAGYGEKTLVKERSSVNINIDGNFIPSSTFPTSLAPGRTFFDVAGGGFNGDVGEWMTATKDVNGETVYVATSSLANPTQKDYHRYEGGEAYVTIEGLPVIRKVVGGGFYAAVDNAETWIKSGTIKSVYGGALLGYVHNNARLAIGSRALLSGEAAETRFSVASNEAETSNKKLFITGDVYGGNDVTGIVGTELWEPEPGTAETYDYINAEKGPLFVADISTETHKGVMLNIYGGTIGGDVYGAGNGYYRGYYVPEWTEYNEGPIQHYRYIRTSQSAGVSNGVIQITDHDETYNVGKAYRARPRVGSVKFDISGNSESDAVCIQGNVYGGGRSCTIGQWNTLLPIEDPRRLSRGGYLQMNIGSNVTIEKDMYLGSRGDNYNTSNTLDEQQAADFDKYFGDNCLNPDGLGALAYDHWWWNSVKNRYEPGFPPPGVPEGNYGYFGEHSYRAYLKNVEMNGDVELTFYDDLYLRTAAGDIDYDDKGNPKRKGWVPGELALKVYDSKNVKIHSFYLGGECGSMTNNKVMIYDYFQGKPVKPEEVDYGENNKNIEKLGSIYRVTLPAGLTLNERIVGGSQNATAIYHPYNDSFTAIDEETTQYTYIGGIVPQCNYSYDRIVYCDLEGILDLDLSSSTFVLKEGDDDYYFHEMKHGPDAGKIIYRYTIPETEMLTNPEVLKDDYGKQRYSLAVLKDGDVITHGYIGDREARDTQGDQTYGKTAVKMTLANQFLLKEDDKDIAEGETVAKHLYGGLVYGGCYNSGNTSGHVIINIGCNLLGKRINDLGLANYGDLSSLEYNIGRVFGGGFGTDTQIDGNTYINLLHHFNGMNVFGGGYQGDVTGSANIVYIGSEKDSFIYGGIYGGGLRGHVGTPDETKKATNIKLYSGNVDKVYGGSCIGDLYGGTNVELCDEVTQKIEHLDYERLLENMDFGSWGGSRLIVGSVYGGNDIAGTITVSDDVYDTTVRIYETQDKSILTGPSSDPSEEGPGKQSPGSDNGYNGFPLVGNLYGGSNGNYGTHDAEADYYSAGEISFATGVGTDTRTFNLNSEKIPHIERAKIVMNGGTVINGYGGGNMTTVTGETRIEVEYIGGETAADPGNRHARAGFENNEELQRVWYTLHLSSEEQLSEVVTKNDDGYVFDYQIFRLFGGNENSEMSIQPSWKLQCGFIGSLYSGGNFGKMTYFNPDPEAGKERGLSLEINSRNLHANAVYGGGRIGDISPAIPDGYDTEGFYGATLKILDGVIDHVYGGNDVSGFVDYGTNVLISGAISGDVYCAGNGNYRYQYDPAYPSGSPIEEKYDDNLGGRYFRLPRKDEFGGDNPKPSQKLLAINSYRPNVEKAFLNIQGKENSVAYVRGNVYCGGNSSTITGETLGKGNDDILFTIGKYVTLNGVFMGSNGYSLADPVLMAQTEELNGIDLAQPNDLTEADASATTYDKDAFDPKLYPSLLDLYMRAVDVNGLPSGFKFPEDLHESYIGNFYVGGNRGSMLADRTIDITFPENLVIYGRIVGGSHNSNLEYKGVSHIGGLIRPLEASETTKLHLTVKNRFEPWNLIYPVENDEREIKMEVVLDKDSKSNLTCFPDQICNVYGGCFDSGRTYGDIRIDLYSDMTSEYTSESKIGHELEIKGIGKGDGLISKRKAITNGIDQNNLKSRRAFAVIGGGFGSKTEVFGNISVRLLPIADEKRPTTAAIFGGMQEGTLVGNTTVELRDGQVLTNLYGGSEAAPMYGSTQIIVGYPEYYECSASGVYRLKRTDDKSKAAKENWTDTEKNGSPVIMNTIRLRKGDIISRRIYDIIQDANKGNLFVLKEDKLPDGYTWNDIQISVGDPASKTDPNAEYLAHGNIYGGGYISSGSETTLAGQNTVCSFRKVDSDYLNEPVEGLGGNSTILIWDNKDNAKNYGSFTAEEEAAYVKVKDHIDIGTCHYVRNTADISSNVTGLWRFNSDIKRFEFIPAFALKEEDKDKYYILETDGGIYGDGRKVLVENFRDVDIAYYGYALGTPQFPKLINTAQHIDLLTISDCCVQFQGANDYATNSINATKYSLTRIGELRMRSSIPAHITLDTGVSSDTDIFKVRHNIPRSRNYIAFHNDVHYIGAFTSDADFDSSYHDKDGVKTASTYKDYKKGIIDDYYSIINTLTEQSDIHNARNAFNKRNIGTAANMIGLINGYVLTVQGVAAEGNYDKTYYGPVTGVFEVKLVTLMQDEGGGYIFALNHHDNPASFLESTGNFVFPGTEFKDNETISYIRDDCFPDGIGWEKYWGWDSNSIYDVSPLSVAEGDTHGNCNELQDCHYWFINGSKYFYNTTLTAYTSNLDQEFTVDNSAGTLYLYDLLPGEKIEVKEVTWETSENQSPDLTFKDAGDRAASLPYRFYLTVDSNPDVIRLPQTEAENGGNWYVTSIPRADYSEAESTVDIAATPTEIDDDINNAFNGDNIPFVGIALIDKNHDNEGREYYDVHLAKDEKVRITLAKKGVDNVEYTYTINLTVRYLLGPSFTGVPTIENCALPGEYIYANSFGVNVDFDEDNMTINARNWYIAAPSECSLDENGKMTLSSVTANDIVKQLNGQPHAEEHAAESLNNEKFGGSDRQIHIPAYLYRNDWRLIYEVIINGQSFLLLPEQLLADKTDKKIFEERLVVHNYHRMDPSANSERYDLSLTEGAKIYIEDDADMEYFFTWLAKANETPVDTTPDGKDINPQYGKGLLFYLMSDVKMPENAPSSSLIFNGTFHGEGHYIDMGDNDSFLGENRGEFYNTGFISASQSDNLAAFKNNNGKLENCFFYNCKSLQKGSLAKAQASGRMVNCYETSPNDTEAIDGLEKGTYSKFDHGEIAYNLNRFYLHKRYLTGNSLDEDADIAPLSGYFKEGDYRYARYSKPSGDAQALRSENIPNYRDYKNIRLTLQPTSYGTKTGSDATFHNTGHPVDESRYDDVSGFYRPIYPQDYLFFGQDLSYDHTSAAIPCPGIPLSANADNRIYRASGFYGSSADKGFHFNVRSLASHPQLTAIDFAGYRDRQLGMKYLKEYPAASDGAYTDKQPMVYYPPMLDLPSLLEEFATTEDVTRNLLVYAPEDKSGEPELEKALEKLVYGKATLEDEISAHLITSRLPDDKTTIPSDAHQPTVALMHLVDKENFHCPIQFKVTETTWYQRRPELFASKVGDAWEGICLPFDVKCVYGSMKENESNNLDRGKLTHFYGPESQKGYYRMVGGNLVLVEGYENETPSHEYWLRKFTGAKEEDNKRKLFFSRPDGDDDSAHNAFAPYLTRQKRCDEYQYANDYFTAVYDEKYRYTHESHERPCYTEEGVIYADYPIITHGLPYLISFPGERFYEFDMSGEFYHRLFPEQEKPLQLVTYGTDGETVIPETKGDEILPVEHGGYTFIGTFTRKDTGTDTGFAMIDGDSQNSQFRSKADGSILPFRTYVVRPGAGQNALYISSRSMAKDEEMVDYQEEPDSPQEEMEAVMEIYVESNNLVIRSPWEMDITVYTISGIAVKTLHVEEGENRYCDFDPGVYILLDTKFLIR